MEQFKKKRLPLLIAGAGGKKSSGSSRTPVEADDTVNSRAMASILDLLGEGVIGGLVDGAKSIFIDDLPILNEDGSPNFSGITWDFRDGSQDQTPMAGFDFVETPKSVNIQLKRTHDVTIAIDNDEADRVRVILKFPSLRSVDKKTGDTNGTTVKYKFQIANGDNAFKDAIAEGESTSEVTLTAKKTGVYYRSYELKLPKPGRAYKIRVIRITEDSNTQYIFNDTWVDSIGEIVDTPMNYPNSALVGLKVNSEQFGSSMPSRSYLVRGLKIRVPSNYNENTNTYIGVWDGTFKLLSSSNPAWILFDVLTNARYGLGQFVSESMIDLGQIYQIGRYCDEEVDNGFGGKEKRFAINTQITSRQDAYRLIQDIAGAFRGMVFWAGGMVNVMQDSPSDPVMMFTNANVKDGMFSYKGSARKDRPSVALVTYNNKEDGYKQNIEYVEDQEAMRRYGERKTEVVAFGCTSRGQAHRVGLWLLYTARMESDVISFTAGLDASFLMPGETVLIQNKYRAGKRNSGRIVAFTKNSITLDAPVTLNKAGSYIRILNQEGEIVERDILETGEDITKVTFSKALNSGDMPVMNGVWTITEPDLEPMRVRVINVAQGDAQGTFDVTVVQNNASKYEAIDNGATLIPENNTVLDPTYSKPTNLQVTEGTYISSPGNLSIKLVATWEGKSAEYWISWRRSDENNVSNWQSARVTEEQFEILNIAENGQYDIQLYAVSFSGKKTDIISTVYQVKGTMTPPGSPTSLTAVGDYRNVILNWVNPDSIDLDHINVYASQTNDLETAKLIAEAASTTFTHAGLGDSETWYYWVRAANKRGMLSPPNSNLGTEATTRDVLSFLTGKITSSELGQELLEEIDTKASQDAVDNLHKQMEESLKELAAADETLQQSQTDLKNEVSGTLDKVNDALQQVEDSNAALVELQETVSEQGKAVAGAVEAAHAALDNASALIAEEREARVEGDKANAKQIEAMKSSVDDSAAAIEEMKKTVAEIDRASSEVTTNIDAIAKTNIDLALRQDEDQHKQMINNAKIATTQKAFADDMSAMATKVEEIRAEIGDEIKASITEETTARVEADKAISKRITALQSQLDDDIKAAIATEQETRATADESLARQITTLKAQTGEDIKAAIGAESSARTDADSALSSQINSLAAQTSEDIKAAITSEATARADADGALGKRVDTIKAEVDGNSAIIQEQAKAIADTNEKVSTAWTLKMETSTSGGQKYVAGIALGIDSTGLSQFLVQADRFGLVNSVNGHITTPFVIENGVAYMNGAWIKNGTIDNAKIGQVIQSDNYAGSSAGWSINKNGNAEFNQVTVRGTVYANQGVFRGRIEAQEGYFNGTVYAEKIEGDVAKAVVLGFNSSIGIPAASYDRHLVIPYIGVHGWTYSGGYGQGGGTVWVDSSYGGRIASVSSTAMHGGGSAYLFLPRNVSTTLSYGGQLDHANAVGTLTVLLFKA
ncbi:phage tail tip fiber protein [Salmonella enterica subsp. enterica]|uniref:phage tail tip fiber protein n=1 Tax=Enterobacteriaceae TaxID=543 RepID=UPI000B260944|nr:MULTISPECIES: phage tail protein [Enterobacteriaceae]MDE9656720.1 phage tail protein [Citrobacter freundii]MDJ4488755.1 phage tail protein [Salmonella enterica]MDL3152659.1 phage tail protein [Salmonella enterica]MEB2724945.1 phage tail protein [Citrobacter braakii]